MMMMPAGPPAMRLLALADVNNAGEAVKMSIARFLTVCYPRPVLPVLSLQHVLTHLS